MSPLTLCRVLVLALPLVSGLQSCGDPASAGMLRRLPPTPLGLKSVSLIVPPDNEMTVEKANLGKLLFHDTRLSSNGEMSCHTCHKHELGWSNGERFSTKVDGTENTRNSPTLYNVGYLEKLYWDGRADTLEGNIEAAWKGHMGGDPEGMANRLMEVPAYAEHFQKAFGAPATGQRIVQALATFVRTLRSGNSPYDRYKAGDVTAISEDAKKGEKLFLGKAACLTCHVPPLFTDGIFHNTGRGTDKENPDIGRGKYDEKLMSAFKTPGLRSVAKSAPYFHDGSAATLEEAVTFMAGGGLENEHRDPLLEDRKLTEEEIGHLVAFLQSLTSEEDYTPPYVPQEGE